MPQNKPKVGLTMNTDMTTPSNVQDNPDPILTETLMHDDTNQTQIKDRTRSNNSNQPPTDNTVMDDLGTNHETLTLQSPHPPATKWSDLLNETTENEITTERQKKKREQSNGTTRTDDDKVEKGNKNDEAQGYQPKPATSLQQAKKIKVEKEITVHCERTRKQLKQRIQQTYTITFPTHEPNTQNCYH